MLSIRDTISRIGRFAKQVESIQPKRKGLVLKKKAPDVRRRSEVQEISSNDQTKFSALAQNYQRHVFREFLEPLNIPNLKIYDNLQKYDSNKATLNWKRTKKNGGTDMFLLEDRLYFEKMMDYLIKVIPDLLKEPIVEDNRYNTFPSKWFGEIPPIPSPLTSESFQEYIYILTHTRFYYRNSLSLKSGLVPQILLYTHNVNNEEFAKVRSVHTYNYLIKFFGYDKNQSSFARELLLVMRKDGHSPNIDTINNLLKHCKTHSHIRSNTNTYQVVLEYLRLALKLQVQINLLTFNRVYDSINNIFLRELFLTKMQLMNIPMLKHLILKIVDDFAETTKITDELITFIESDLNHRDWKNDGRFANKVLHHRSVYLEEKNLDQFWLQTQNESQMDEYTLKALMEGVKKSKLNHKMYILLKLYCSLSSNSKNVVVYRYLITELLSNITRQNVDDILLLVRGVMNDMVLELELPKEVIEYGKHKGEPESVKILRTMIGDKFGELELLMKMVKGEIDMRDDEIEDWNYTKRKLLKSPLSDCTKDVLELFTTTEKVNIPQGIIEKHKSLQKHKVQNLRVKLQILKLREGMDDYTKREMMERGILSNV